MEGNEFELLTLKQKVKTLYVHGTFIVAIRYYKYKVNLYSVNNYLVEVFFNHKQDMIEKIEIMDQNSTRLKFYSDQVKLVLN
jgi:hypothetical protein